MLKGASDEISRKGSWYYVSYMNSNFFRGLGHANMERKLSKNDAKAGKHVETLKNNTLHPFGVSLGAILEPSWVP